jgi:SAM-dependent methyltransferase
MPDEHYRGGAGRFYHESKRAVPEQAFSWVARLRAEKFQAHIRTTDVVFEYGVGFGWNLAELQCARKIGLDVAEFLEAGNLRHGIEFVTDSKSCPTESIDAVICHHTLEHVPNPLDVLGDIRRLLRPGGKLLAAVPFEKERKYRRYDPLEPNHHLFSWNVQTLGNLVAEGDFKIVETGLGCFGYDRFAAVQAVKWRLGETGFRLIRRAVHLVKPGREVRLLALKP